MKRQLIISHNLMTERQQLLATFVLPLLLAFGLSKYRHQGFCLSFDKPVALVRELYCKQTDKHQMIGLIFRLVLWLDISVFCQPVALIQS